MLEWSPDWRVYVYSCVGIHQQCLTRAGWEVGPASQMCERYLASVSPV